MRARRARRIASGLLFACFCLCLAGVACSSGPEGRSDPEGPSRGELRVSSPDGRNTIHFRLVDGEPKYSITRGDRTVIDESAMGFVFKGEHATLGPFEVAGSETTSFDETWEQVWGETRFVRNQYQQLLVSLRETDGRGRRMDLEFRAFDDGVAFRYLYPQQGDSDLVILDELTEFRLPTDGTAWWIGAYQDNRYEYLTTESRVSEIGQAHTPLTIRTDDGLFLSFHEARLVDFASLVVERNEGTILEADLVPWADGDRVKTDGSFTSPWRTLQIAERSGDLITSNLILNLNDPNRLADTSWIHPHKYLGIWWGMHIGKFTFWESPTQGATRTRSRTSTTA